MIKWIKNLRNKPETIEEPEDESLVKKFDKNQYTGSWARPKMNIGAACDKIFARKHDSLKLCSLDGDLVSAMDAESVAAMDSGFDTSSLYPNDVPEKILEFFGAHGFIGWQACAILRQNYLIDAACSIPANDAMATGYKLSYAENNETESDKKDDGVEDEELAKIERESDETYHIGEVCRRMTVNKKTFGIALAIPIVKGADMTKPFNIDGIKKGTYKGFSVVEPYWAAPQMDSDAASDPASLHFYEPTWWRIGGGELVHRSWCIKIVNTTLPDILKPSYYYGGVPLTQMIYERVYAADTTANEAPLLAKSKRLLIADADVSNMIANPAEAKDITEASSYFRDNWNIWFKNPLDQVSQIDTSLAGLDEVIMTQYQLCASIAEMPATKLLKTSPKGFNATGDYEWKDYAQTLVEIQEHDFKPIIQMHNMLYTKSTTGKEIPLIVTFAPVDVPTDKELAEVEEIRSRVDTNYSNSGVVSPEEIRDIARNADGSRFSTLPEISESDMDIDSDAEELSNKVAEDAAFLESEHPRDDDGKFGEGGGGKSKADESKKSGSYDLESDPVYERLITSQEFIDDDIVDTKRDDKDYDVSVSPKFEIDGDEFQVILDGHHSLRAAELDGEKPNFTVLSEREDDRISLLIKGDEEGFLDAVHMSDGDYTYVKNGGSVWQ